MRKQMSMRSIGFGLMSILGLFTAFAQVRVVTTYPDIADLVKQVGGSRVQVSALARPQDDPHLVTPRPSLALELSRAKLFVRIGMDLDLWVDDMLTGARNAKILKGGAGYVDCSVGVKKLEVPTGQIDPSQGDIHLYGNPHILLDPVNAKIAARNILEGLKRVAPGDTGQYEQNYARFAQRIDESLPRWQKILAPFQGASIVQYHKTFVYFFQRFKLREFGTVEPKPGIPPSPGYLRGLIDRMKSGQCRVILIQHFHSHRFPDTIARETGARVVVVPTMVGAEGTRDYFEMIDTIVNRVATALAGK